MLKLVRLPDVQCSQYPVSYLPGLQLTSFACHRPTLACMCMSLAWPYLSLAYLGVIVQHWPNILYYSSESAHHWPTSVHYYWPTLAIPASTQEHRSWPTGHWITDRTRIESTTPLELAMKDQR